MWCWSNWPYLRKLALQKLSVGNCAAREHATVWPAKCKLNVRKLRTFNLQLYPLDVRRGKISREKEMEWISKAEKNIALL